MRAVIPALVVAAMMTSSSYAASVTGQANISGTATVSLAGIMFGAFTVSAPNTGDFAGLTGGSLANLLGPPVTGPISVPNFGIFNVGAGTIHFDLTSIDPGTGTAGPCTTNALGAPCTPAGSPFTLTQTGADSVSIALRIVGMAYLNTNTGDSDSFAIFTTQNVVPGTVSGILADVFTTGFQDSYSATFAATPITPTVPEPASLLLMGVGLLGAGIIARKKIRN